ncbi:hypothetical protein SAMN05660199_02119 [Klenkia soli]|uniref:Uncharacterized protein n=1 Tax=Klenkia soli TaxID=1052260 RepID=A0A1H0KEI1_9ACTN|nr:hypothetical protein [Klenkia soli]SDO54368.1 hypothetical protein SAMN05660199_02119 [Klenkia soli]
MRPPAHTPRPRRTRALVVGAVLVGTATLSACQLPDVSMSPSLADRSTSAAATTSATAEPTPASAVDALQAAETAAPTTTPRPAGELDPGSVTHVVAAGDRQLVVDWWTTGSPTTWTAADEKTLQLSAHLEGGDPDEELEVLVTRFTAVLDDGTTRTTVSDDQGQFAIQAPYTYGTALSLPASTAGVASVTVDLQFDLLVETEPGSQRYFRQTVLDSLVLPLVVPQESE